MIHLHSIPSSYHYHVLSPYQNLSFYYLFWWISFSLLNTLLYSYPITLWFIIMNIHDILNRLCFSPFFHSLPGLHVEVLIMLYQKYFYVWWLIDWYWVFCLLVLSFAPECTLTLSWSLLFVLSIISCHFRLDRDLPNEY